MRLLALAAALGAFVMPSAANAQEGDRVGIQQLEQRAPASAAAAQIAPAGAGHDAPRNISSDAAVVPGLGADAPTQVRPLAQVTAERGRSDAGAQLTREAPTAEAPVSGTDRREGRNTRTEVLEGEDRCDPEQPRLPGEVCRRVIETRAAEFRAPEVQPLSAEQRLLVAQRELDTASRDTGSAARRLANGQVDESNAALAVASFALGGSTPPADDRKEEPTAPSAVDAIVSAIVSGMGGALPQP